MVSWGCLVLMDRKGRWKKGLGVEGRLYKAG